MNRNFKAGNIVINKKDKIIFFDHTLVKEYPYIVIEIDNFLGYVKILSSRGNICFTHLNNFKDYED